MQKGQLTIQWKIIYDFLYVFIWNIGNSTHRFWYIIPNKSQTIQIGPFWPLKWPLD